MKALLVLALLLLMLVAPVQAQDHHENMCEELATGEAFGLHVAEHAQDGILGALMNPGHHMGYSPCVP